MAKKKQKFVIRHYWRAWVDITVSATDLDEAYEKADEAYNEGNYYEDPEDFENEAVDDVTEIYVENKLPFPNEVIG